MIDLSNIKKIRTKLRLSQSELAHRAGVTQAHIAKIETGKVDPRFSTVKKIFDCLEKEEKVSCEQYMTPAIVSAKADQKIPEIIKMMRQKGISQVPVFKGSRVVGIITEEDILKSSHDLRNTKVKEIMEESPPSVSKYTSIDTVKSLLLEFPAVIVMDAGKTIGIITKSNMLK